MCIYIYIYIYIYIIYIYIYIYIIHTHTHTHTHTHPHTHRREVVLAEGPDVMFEVVDLDATDDTVEVFAAEFFAQRLTMHSLKWSDEKGLPCVVQVTYFRDNKKKDLLLRQKTPTIWIIVL